MEYERQQRELGISQGRFNLDKSQMLLPYQLSMADVDVKTLGGYRISQKPATIEYDAGRYELKRRVAANH